VARARELAQVGRTLFALAGSLAQGAVAPAAQALEAVLARLLPVALDFLARTFGLDQLPRLLRLGLEALRRPIDKGLDWVLGKIVQLAKNAGKAGKKGVENKLPKAALTAPDSLQLADNRTPTQKQEALQQAVAAGTTLLREEQLSHAKLATHLAAIRQQYRLTSLRLVTESETTDFELVHLHGAVNPQQRGPSVRRARPLTPGAVPRPPVQVQQAIRALYQQALAPAHITEVDDRAQLVRHRFTNPRLITAVHKNTFAEFNAKLQRGEIVLVNNQREYLLANRPKYRPNLVEDVWAQAQSQDVNGRVYDPNVPTIELFWDRTKNRSDQWHMGHRSGKEYRTMVDDYIRGRTTYQEFLAEYNDKANYQPEDPRENSSHRHEAP